MSQAIRLSIVTPSYNQSDYLGWTMDSILNQGYPDLEYLVIDGGSSDQSRQVIQQRSSRLAWWCSEKDRGQTDAINKGFHRCTGEVVGWVNSDDMLLPGALARVAEAFSDPQVQAVCGWAVIVAPSGWVRRREVFPQPTRSVLLYRNPLMQPAVFWRRRLFDQMGFLDESFSFCMDREFWVRLAIQGMVPRLIPHYLAAYRKHAATKTNTISDVGRQEFDRIDRTIRQSENVDASDLPASVQSELHTWDRQASWLRFWREKATMLIPPYARYQPVHPKTPA